MAQALSLCEVAPLEAFLISVRICCFRFFISRCSEFLFVVVGLLLILFRGWRVPGRRPPLSKKRTHDFAVLCCNSDSECPETDQSHLRPPRHGSEALLEFHGGCGRAP